MNDKDRMIRGLPYMASDFNLIEERKQARLLLEEYNRTSITESKKRASILSQLLGQCDDSTYIEPHFRCDYGYNITVGKNFYANYDLIILDCAPVKIGDNVMFGPRVGLYAASHPIDATIRDTGLELSAPIMIGNHVWLCGDVTVVPGVTIGDNTIVGAGSVVTKDLPSNVIAAGNPCCVRRSITSKDYQYWKQVYQSYQQEMKD